MTAEKLLAKALQKRGCSPEQSEKVAAVIAAKSKPRSICEEPKRTTKEDK